MTKSDQNTSNPSDSAEEQFLQEISISKHISQQANDLFKEKRKNPKDFLFEADPNATPNNPFAVDSASASANAQLPLEL